MNLLLFLVLLPLAVCNLEAPLLPLIAACDAAPAYGFGGRVRRADIDTVAALADDSSQLSSRIEVAGPEHGDVPRFYHGPSARLPYTLDSFTDIFSIRAKAISHSGAMEAHGLLLLVRGLARSPTRVDTRVVVGVDAQAVLYPAKKGRSSSRALRVPLMQIGALCLAFWPAVTSALDTL